MSKSPAAIGVAFLVCLAFFEDAARAQCAPLELAVRADIARRYNCGSDRTVCIDAANGLPFCAENGAWLESNRTADGAWCSEQSKGVNWGFTAGTGEQVMVRAFANPNCATLSTMVVDSSSVHFRDVLLRGQALKKAEETLEQAKKDAAKAKNPDEVKKVVSEAVGGLKALKAEAPKSIDNQLDVALQQLSQQHSAIANGADGAAVAEAIGDAQKKLEAAPDYPVFTLPGGRSVAQRDESITLPTDETVRFYNLRVSFRKDGSNVAPTALIQVSLDHGYYYVDPGVMLAGVHQAVPRFREDGSLQSRDAAVQTMAVLNVYPWGRSRFRASTALGLIPGLQVGINPDVTKLAREGAISVGGVWEPVSGIGLGGGAMLYGRVAKAVDQNGEAPRDHVILPYAGFTLSTELYNTIKTAVSGDSKKAEPKPEAGGSGEKN